MKTHPFVLAFCLGLLAAFFWGTHSVMVRYLTTDIHGLTIAVVRLYVAAFVLYLVIRAHKHPVAIKLSDRAFLVTVFGTVTNYVLFHIGLERTSASNAMLLENTAPFFVVIFLLIFMKRRVRAVDIVATLLAVLGTFFAVKYDALIGGEGFDGDVLEILAGLTWAIFIVGSTSALAAAEKTIERISFMFNLFIVSAIILTPFAFIYPAHPTWSDVVVLVMVGVFPTAIAYCLWFEAAALLFTLSVIFTLVNAHIFLGEVLTTDMILGAVLIVAGVALSKFDSKNA